MKQPIRPENGRPSALRVVFCSGGGGPLGAPSRPPSHCLPSGALRLLRRLRVLALTLGLAVALLGAPSCAGEPREVLVFAAASLGDALLPVGEAFTLADGTPVRFSFAGSGELAQQVDRGALPDLFIAAGAAPMDRLEASSLLEPGTRTDLLTNSLVVVVRRDSGLEMAAPEDLLAPGVARIAMADPRLTPAGDYARQSLTSLGLWAPLQPRIVYGLNVRTALDYVAAGHTDVGLVYRTDAEARVALTALLELPEASHASIRYPVAVLHEAPSPAPARRFLAFLQSAEARYIFRAQGFTPIEGRARPAPTPGTPGRGG